MLFSLAFYYKSNSNPIAFVSCVTMALYNMTNTLSVSKCAIHFIFSQTKNNIKWNLFIIVALLKVYLCITFDWQKYFQVRRNVKEYLIQHVLILMLVHQTHGAHNVAARVLLNFL